MIDATAFRRTRAASSRLTAACGVSRGVGAGQEQAYRAPRTPDNAPDLSGIWQANNTANWDLEPHEARMGPVVALAAAFSIPPRPRRRRRRRDPVPAGGAREAQRESRRLGEARSRDQVLHAGHPARDLHAVSVSDRAVEGQRHLHLRVHQREPHRAHEQRRRRARRRRGWDGRSASGTASRW